MDTIYTLGYMASTPDALAAYVDQHDALLVDIRYAPYSRNPNWGGPALRGRFGARYVACRAYGNVNFRGGPIQLDDPDAAVRQLGPLLERQNVVLLCCCSNPSTCHRKVAAEHLSAATGAPVVHLPGKPTGSLPENSMKALSLTAPWAHLLFVPDPKMRKSWETRSWQTAYRGKLAIHAAKGFPRAARDLYDTNHYFRNALRELPGVLKADSPSVLPLGVILGTVDLVDITSALALASSLSATERAFGDYGKDRYAWQLANPLLFPEPIPARGALGLWSWTPPQLTVPDSGRR